MKGDQVFSVGFDLVDTKKEVLMTVIQETKCCDKNSKAETISIIARTFTEENLAAFNKNFQEAIGAYTFLLVKSCQQCQAMQSSR